MARSSKADKARQLNAAYKMLLGDIPLSEAMQRLSREFDLSERQAYRYLEEARTASRLRSLPIARACATQVLIEARERFDFVPGGP